MNGTETGGGVEGNGYMTIICEGGGAGDGRRAGTGGETILARTTFCFLCFSTITTTADTDCFCSSGKLEGSGNTNRSGIVYLVCWS